MADEDIARQWRAAVYDDLSLLAMLHDRELDQTRLDQIREHGFPHTLGLQFTTEKQRESQAFMARALGELPQTLEPAAWDDLAADFAAIYLNNSLQASPCESVWLDEEHLMRQQPMFAVREWYQQHGLEVEDWRKRPDDHLVCQLQFLAHLLNQPDPSDTLSQAARFLDEHLLLWIEDFGTRVAQRAGTAFFAALAVLTWAYVENLRTVLASFVEPEPIVA